MTTFAELLLKRAEDDSIGYVFEDQEWTWREVVEESTIRAALLSSLRRPGPFHVGVLLENVPEYLFLAGGAALCGATIVGINPTRRGEELAYDIRHTDCQVVFTDSAGHALLSALDLGELTVPRAIVDIESSEYAAHLASLVGVAAPTSLPAPETPLFLLFTSGSTNAPKAVICSAGRFGLAGERAADAFGVTRGDVMYCCMPLFHGNALIACWAPGAATGARIVLRRRFSASGFGPDVRRYGVTYFTYVGRTIAYLLAQPPMPLDHLNGLRLGFGTEASAQDRARFEDRFGCLLVEGYGSSESVVSITRTPDTPPAALGRPRPDQAASVAVVDPATGTECLPAEFDEHGRLTNATEAIGEIVNRAGGDTFEGYYNNAEATADRLHDGWYWTGDLAYRDHAGFFYFAGRDADWLRVDSENFSAAPVERILERLPGAAVVAVYPVPDPRTGDQVMAAIEMAQGVPFDPGMFASFLDAQRDLGTKWAPTFVRVVTAMPVTASNKVNKQPLRADRWTTTDPIFWRERRTGVYRALTAGDRAIIDDEFAEGGRLNAL